MTDPRACEEMRLLLQADLDGELDAAATAVLAAHVAECPGCVQEQREVTQLSARLRAGVPRHAAPALLRAALQAKLAPARAAARPGLWRRLRPMLPLGALSFGAGAALAAGVAVMLAVSPQQEAIEAQAVAGHVRALQPGHLTDVLSADLHTVKPWFAGRIDYAPPVPDLQQAGFPLLGGRLDYLAGRAVAVLVYGRGKHVIDLYLWPDPHTTPPGRDIRDGYGLLYWDHGGIRCIAVSDVEPAALAQFARLWSAAT